MTAPLRCDRCHRAPISQRRAADGTLWKAGDGCWYTETTAVGSPQCGGLLATVGGTAVLALRTALAETIRDAAWAGLTPDDAVREYLMAAADPAAADLWETERFITLARRVYADAWRAREADR